jgi:hypothetical protein
MNHKILKFALGVTFSIAAISASAQKTYTEGVATYNLKTDQGEIESPVTFKGDSSMATMQQGPALIKLISTNKGNYFLILVDVPVASMKKAVVLTPDELEQASAAAPKFTFTPTTETKQINGFNCKKVIAKDPKSGATYDAWVTSDISAPGNSYSKYFSESGGFPVQFTTMQQGKVVNVTLKSITDQKVPAGTFAIPAGFDRISMEELNSMRGGN